MASIIKVKTAGHTPCEFIINNEDDSIKTILDLKHALVKESGISAERQIIAYSGSILLDTELLSELMKMDSIFVVAFTRKAVLKGPTLSSLASLRFK